MALKPFEMKMLPRKVNIGTTHVHVYSKIKKIKCLVCVECGYKTTTYSGKGGTLKRHLMNDHDVIFEEGKTKEIKNRNALLALSYFEQKEVEAKVFTCPYCTRDYFFNKDGELRTIKEHLTLCMKNNLHWRTKKYYTSPAELAKFEKERDEKRKAKHTGRFKKKEV